MKDNKYYLAYNSNGRLRKIGIVKSGHTCTENDTVHPNQRMCIMDFYEFNKKDGKFTVISDNWYLDIKNPDYKSGDSDEEFIYNNNLTIIDPLNTGGLPLNICILLIEIATLYIGTVYTNNQYNITLERFNKLLTTNLELIFKDEFYITHNPYVHMYSTEEVVKNKLMKFPLMKERYK